MLGEGGVLFTVGQYAEQGLEILRIALRGERFAEIDRRTDIVRDLSQLRKVVMFAAERGHDGRKTRYAFLSRRGKGRRRCDVAAHVDGRPVMLFLNDHGQAVT